jgi:hypothetical protein
MERLVLVLTFPRSGGAAWAARRRVAHVALRSRKQPDIRRQRVLQPEHRSPDRSCRVARLNQPSESHARLAPRRSRAHRPRHLAANYHDETNRPHLVTRRQLPIQPVLGSDHRPALGPVTRLPRGGLEGNNTDEVSAIPDPTHQAAPAGATGGQLLRAWRVFSNDPMSLSRNDSDRAPPVAAAGLRIAWDASGGAVDLG